MGLINLAFENLLKNTSDMIFIKDINLVYQGASTQFVKMVGKNSTDEIVGHTDHEIFVDKQLAKRYESDDRKIIANQKDLLQFIEPITDADGQPRYGSTSKYLLRDENGEILGILGITKDVTTEYRMRKRYQQELEYLFDLPEDTYDVLYVDVDDWRVIKQRRKNLWDGDLSGYQTIEETCAYIIDAIANKDCEAMEFYKNFEPKKLWELYSSGRNSFVYEYERRLLDGSMLWIRNEVHFLMDADSGHLCVMLLAKDINDSKQEEFKIQKAAKYDQMTMLFNRETAMDNINSIISREESKSHVLFMLDIDNFKALNDTLGHQAGDSFLINLAKNLRKSFRDSDIIGRIGGDEFFIFVQNLYDIKQINKKAADILDIVREVADKYEGVNISGSVGGSLYPKSGNNLEMLYAKADKALYQAKRAGKNQYSISDC